MLCKKPYRKENLQFGCGQCTHCRINKVRQWQGRMILEQAHTKTESAFVTLTYNDDTLPNPPHVDKRHVQLFLKQLRNLSGRKFRYFAVGEYGEQSWRPHYHLIIFGLFPTEESLVQKAWSKGFVYMGQCTEHSISYVVSYVVKQMTKPNDKRLSGKTPEFSLKSQGIGKAIVNKYVEQWNSEKGLAAFEQQRWISTQFKVGARQSYPLGRYLTDKICTGLGLTKEHKKIHTTERSREIWLAESGLTATERAQRRAIKLAQQNAHVRMKKKGTL